MKIEAVDLKKIYSGKEVVDISSFTINQGELFGLVGNNGAGKTTFFRLILDLIKADGGKVLSNGIAVNESTTWKAYTGSFLDNGFLIDFLTPEEYLYFVGELYGLSKTTVDERLKAFDRFFNDEVLSKKGKLIRDFSRGNQQKIGITAAIIIEPKVLVLDEPFNALDPTSQIILKEMVKDISHNKGTTVLISSHDLNHIAETCTRIALLEKGKIIKDMQTNENALNELIEYFGQGVNVRCN